MGPRRACDVLLGGLARLEYRGYDSAGVALVPQAGVLNVYKSAGKVDALRQRCAGGDTTGGTGIAHTRWATHGAPTDMNAHPHVSGDGAVALVHNGTIENYAALRAALERHGVGFRSETDTEALVQLIAYVRRTTACTLPDAVAAALAEVEGAYAIAVVAKDDPRTLVVARKSSPLVIGLGQGETFVASDATPIVGYTDKVVYLHDGELGVITPAGLDVRKLDGTAAPRPEVRTLRMSVEEIEKGGYDTFMLKEIYEQPRTLRDCLRGRIADAGRRVALSGVELHKDVFRQARRVIFVACGTSWHAALIGKHLVEDLARVPARVEYASEFRYANPVIGQGDVVVALSQSGETADTLAAIGLAKEKGAFVYGICNVVGASIPRATDSGTYIHVGPEIGVASTKAFTGQVTVLALLAIAVAQLRDAIAPERVRELTAALEAMPDTITEVLRQDHRIEQTARMFTYARNALYLGRGYNYPTALEGALKLKEISYIHAEGYPAAEMKHGPIALIDSDMPTIIIAPDDSLHDKLISNIQQVKSRGGAVVALVSRGDSALRAMVDVAVDMPAVPECLTPIVAAVPLQLLAYHIARFKKKDVDQPRNLAKSVTVE